MALQSTGPISMSDILEEKGITSNFSTISLRGLSVDGQNDYLDTGTSLLTDLTGSPNQTAPYGMAEFYSWASVLDFASPTLTAREYDGTWTSHASDTSIANLYFRTGSGIQAIISSNDIKIERGSTSGYTVQWRPAATTNLTSRFYYNTSGTFTSLTANTAWHTIASGSETPDSAAWNGTQISAANNFGDNGSTQIASSTAAGTFAPAQNTFQALGAGQSIGVRITASDTTSSGTFGASFTWDVQFKLRKSGYNDADPIVRFSYRASPSVESTGSGPNPFPF